MNIELTAAQKLAAKYTNEFLSNVEQHYGRPMKSAVMIASTLATMSGFVPDEHNDKASMFVALTLRELCEVLGLDHKVLMKLVIELETHSRILMREAA